MFASVGDVERAGGTLMEVNQVLENFVLSVDGMSFFEGCPFQVGLQKRFVVFGEAKDAFHVFKNPERFAYVVIVFFQGIPLLFV